MSKIKIDENNTDTFVICPICQAKLSKIVHWHIKNHNLTVKQFEEKYNLSSTQRSCIALRRSTACTYENMTIRYGETKGKEKWKEYCDKQAIKNTFNFKQEKYGWTKEQFNDYNKKRASTESNFVKRYGVIEGKKKWKDYCELQSYTGSSIEWFVIKLGKEEGEKKWKEICLQKRIIESNFIRKYGAEEGKKKWALFLQNRQIKRNLGYSIISQELFQHINNVLQQDRFSVYFESFNYEYLFNKSGLDSVLFVDFFYLPKRKVIEFYGDYWHCNPLKYSHDFIISQNGLTAKEIWEKDTKRIESLKNNFNISTFIVWENEYKTNKELTIKRCLDFLNE